MHRQTKATSIPASVKAAVAIRDCSGGHPATVSSAALRAAHTATWCADHKADEGTRRGT